MNYIKLLSFLLAAITPFLCRSQTLVLCSAEQGRSYLSQDPFDGYYDKVNPLEIAIQLKDPEMHKKSREEAIKAYRASYEKEVLEINEDEAKKLREMFAKLFANCQELNKNLLPDTIRLIMVEGNHYGASTFFTRGNAIVLSRSSLASMPTESFEDVMYHELFHIVSRYHPSLRTELYAHLGFEYIDGPIWIEQSFFKKMLYNPDGVSSDHGIELQMEDSSLLTFIPIISASADAYSTDRSSFFQYLHFQLYPLDPVSNGHLLRSPKECEKLNYNHIMNAYFERITRNTNYIIHPDELLADNFLYLFRSEEDNKELDQNLLNAIRTTLKDYKH